MSEVRTLFYPGRDGTFTVESTQDVEPILERNKALQALPQRSDWGRHVASIPNVVWMQWMKETNGALDKMPKPDLTRFIRKKLADPSNQFLRTA